MKRLHDLELKNKRVLIREDLNVPFDHDGNISSDIRIRAALPTIIDAQKNGAAVILMSHLGRPIEGRYDEKYSLAPVAKRLSKLLEQEVSLITDWSNGVEVKPGQVVLLENVRFNKGEKANDDDLAKQYAQLADIFVMDAFATAHRAQASTHGVAKYTSTACAGPLLENEVRVLTKALDGPEKPFVAIVGGSKVSTKLSVLKNLIDTVDQLIVGGGMANTFIAAAGYEVGKSLYEPDLIGEADDLMKQAQSHGAEIPIPIDVIVATEVSADAEAEVKLISEVDENDRILDIGPETTQMYIEMLENAKTIVWNGPVGVFELDAFAKGTKALAEAIAKSSAFTVAGGGDTLAAIDQYQISDKISYISTGGGAFLELLEGKTLPAITILEQKGS